MSDDFPSRVTSIGEKLRQARHSLKLTTREAAERLSSRKVSISHVTIGNYENSKSVPNLEVLAAFAELYKKPITWFLDAGPTLSGVRYRNLKSKLKLSDRQWFEANAQRWLEAYIKLEVRLGQPLSGAGAPDLKPGRDEGGGAFAKRLRQELGLRDEDPIHSVIELMERFGIRTMEMKTELPIDGFAARFGGNPVVILNPSTANDRCRMNAAHEWGHIALGDCDEGSGTCDKEADERAFEFASHLLLPPSQLQEAFRGQSMVKLVRFKERFGISLAGMIYQAERSGILPKDKAKWLWTEFAKRRWRVSEPGYVRPDRSIRFEYLVESALAEEVLTWTEMLTLLGVRADELRERLDMAWGKSRDQEEGEDGQAGDVLQFPR